MEGEPQKLSKAQKRRLKTKQKKQESKEEQPPQQELVQPEVSEPAPAPRKKGKKKGKIAAIAQQAALLAQQEEEERQRIEEEAKLREIELEKQRLAAIKKRKDDEIALKKQQEKEKQEAIRLGLYKTKSQREKEKRDKQARERFQQAGNLQIPIDSEKPQNSVPSNKKKKQKPQSILQATIIEEEKVENNEIQQADEQFELDNWEDYLDDDAPAAQEEAEQYEQQAEIQQELRFERAATPEAPNLRAPIVCILGHVDTGKTKLLDKIRRTNVQVGEAGGITQQIGATIFPRENIQTLISKLYQYEPLEIEVPGLLIIDTPGHESFTNLRSRGSSLCDLGILVVDIMHGLEKQTLESLEMLVKKNIPFIVALNKVDRLYEWQSSNDEAFRTQIAIQAKHVIDEFRKRLNETISSFAVQQINAALYWENPEPDTFINLVPTSAHTGEGIPDMLFHLVKMAQTQIRDKIRYRDQLQATVMEVKVIEGLGTTIDVILANGELKESDIIVVAGQQNPIATNIRALLTPQPLRELRVRADYIHHSKIHGAIGVKIVANGLENALAGSQLLKVTPGVFVEDLQAEVQQDIMSIFSKVSRKGEGVHVQASTMGSLEALLEFLKESKIPVSSLNIGPVHKKDVIKAQGQIEKGNRLEFATVLAFDVKIANEAQEYADHVGVKIFQADIIYHLFDAFTQYVAEIRHNEKLAQGKGKEAIFPCVLKIVPDGVFHSRSPIVLGVDILGGVLKVGTPLCVPDRDNLMLGRVESIEQNHKPLQECRSGSAAIKIRPQTSDQEKIAVGRNFDESSQIVSHITRKSIDALKEFFMEEMTMPDWRLVKTLKTTFGILQ